MKWATLLLPMMAGLFTAKGFAAVYDLRTQSTVVVPTDYGDAIFTTDYQFGSGTGGYEPFLTLQGSPTEQGYNTSAGVWDTKRQPQYNHEIRLGDLRATAITYFGVQYFAFTLDINEGNNSASGRISLDSLKLFLSTTPSQTTTNEELLGTKVFDLDPAVGQGNTILYDDSSTGSGKPDIAFFIPATAISALIPNSTYVYMYQKFGGYSSGNTDFDTGGGFEETRIGSNIQLVPEPSAVLPLAGALGFALSSRRLGRRRNQR